MSAELDMTLIQEKTCTKCSRDLPATKDFFTAAKLGKFGLSARCKQCDHEYYLANKEHIRARNDAYYLANKERLDKAAQEYRKANAEKARDRARKWYYSHIDRVRANKKRYYYSHQEEIIEKEKKRYREQVERERSYARENGKKYRSTEHGKALRRLHEIRRRAKKKAVGGDYTVEDIQNLYEVQKGLCWWCSSELNEVYHIDHRIPLDKDGSNFLSNIVLACPTCNLSKGRKLPHEWNGRLL